MRKLKIEYRIPKEQRKVLALKIEAIFERESERTVDIESRSAIKRVERAVIAHILEP